MQAEDNYETMYFELSSDALRQAIVDFIRENGGLCDTDIVTDIEVTMMDDMSLDTRVVIFKE